MLCTEHQVSKRHPFIHVHISGVMRTLETVGPTVRSDPLLCGGDVIADLYMYLWILDRTMYILLYVRIYITVLVFY